MPSPRARTTTHCPYCSLNCGLHLEVGRVDGDEQVVRTVRWKGSPLTRGGLCAKGVSAWEQIHHAERLRAPLVREGDRLVPATWDEALDRAAEGFLGTRDAHGPDASAVLGSGSLTNEKAYLLGKLARLAIGTPHVDLNGRMCMSAAGTANTMAFGLDRAMTPLADLDQAEAVVVIGANLADTYPVEIPNRIAALRRRRGARVIVVDPRAGRWLERADLWLKLRPGTDAVVANGILRELSVLGAVDERFCDDRTFGLADALAGAEPWTPDEVERVADVPAERIREAARILTTDRVMYLHARGAEQQSTGTRNVLAWINVALARGHVGRSGCGIDMLTGQRNGQGGREMGQRCDQLPGARRVDDPGDRAVVSGRWGIDEADLPGAGRSYVELLDDAHDGRVRSMLLCGTNPMVSAPDLVRTARALRRLDHLVVMDLFLSETAAFADVVLPGSSWAEEEGTVTTLEGRVVRCDQAVAPVAERSDVDVLRNLANRLGAGRHLSFVRGREVFEEIRAVTAGAPADLSGMTWDRLRDEDGLFWPCPAGVDGRTDHPGTPRLYEDRFAHADGRARFHRIDPVLRTPDSGRPIFLTTGRVLHHYLSGNQTRRIQGHLAMAPVPVAEIHPVTAGWLGLVAGGLATIASAQGEIVVSWTPSDALRRDTIFLPYHWPVANSLTAADELDPESKIPNLRVTPVTVRPAAALATRTRSVAVPTR
jgi:assimilatory nitrate reductase catalytic subunit